MMKRFALLLALCLLLCGAALAEEYTDVPGAPTQDEVLSLEAAWQDAEQTPYALQTLVPDQLTVDTVTAAYKRTAPCASSPRKRSARSRRCWRAGRTRTRCI